MKIARDENHNVAYIFDSDANLEQQIIDYWTPERKREAIPIMPDIPFMEYEIEKAAMPTTKPKKADLRKMPFSASGKLFFTLDNKKYVASANIMERSNILVTAAHCVQDMDNGNIGENFLFERCYNCALAPEKLTFKAVALTDYWHSENDREEKWKWDYAIAVLKKNSTVASPLKYSTKNIQNETITTFGYPTNYLLGEQMVFVKGAASPTDINTWIINGCKMRGGCSGGAWVLSDNKTIVGVNSYGPESKKEAYVASPIFDENFESLYKYALTLI